MTTETEEHTESIVEALTASWNEAEAETETVDAETPEEISEPLEVAEADDGEDTPIEENEVAADAEEVNDDAEPVKVFQAPEHWSSELQEQFAALDPSAQEILITRDKEFQQGHQEQAQGMTEIQQALAPWKQTIAQLGVSEGQAIRTLFATYNQLLSDPQRGMQALAANFGLSDQFTVPDTNDDFTDPDVKALRAQVNQLQNVAASFGQAQQQNVQSEGTRLIEEFKSAKTDDGKVAHPHFDDCIDLILPLVSSGKNLEEAYEQAVWSVPQFRDGRVPDKGPTAAQKAAKVKQARKAANTVKQSGKDSPDTAKEDLSLEDELAAVWNEATQ